MDPVIFAVCLFIVGTTILTWCFGTLTPNKWKIDNPAVRTKTIESWSTLSYSKWLVLAVYVDSYLFVFSTSILQVGIGLSGKLATCEAAIFMCIFFYCSSKVVIYLFLIERVHIVRGRTRTRMRDKLYLFHLGGLLPYCVIVVLAIIFRINQLNETGRCYIGLRRESSFLLLIYDLVINVYLTGQFLLPILGLYSFKHAPNTRLRKVAQRTLVGTLATLASSITNVSAVFALKGLEPAFICLSCCTADVAFSAIVLHWVTSVQEESTGYAPTSHCAFHNNRTSAICCMQPNGTLRGDTKQGTRNGTQVHMGTKASQHDPHEILPGVDFVKGGTVITEVDCGPAADHNNGKGLLSKAKELAGRFSRISNHRRGSEHMRSQHANGSDEEIEMHGPGGSAGVIVSYDVWRTIEESEDAKKSEGNGSLATK